MGPVRRQLITAATFCTASPAWAESCDLLRPGWNGTSATAWSELLFFLQTPVVLVLILATALALRFRSEWGGLAVVVGWSIVTYLVAIWGTDTPDHIAARAQGCIGSPALFIAVAAALSVGVVLYTAPLPKRNKG